MDYTYQLPHIVIPGEMITPLDLQVYPGGKGLNQSVAVPTREEVEGRLKRP